MCYAPWFLFCVMYTVNTMEAVAWGAFWGGVANGLRQAVTTQVATAKKERMVAVQMPEFQEESGLDDHFLTLLENSGGTGHISTAHLQRAASHAKRAFALYNAVQTRQSNIQEVGRALPHYVHMICQQNTTLAITLLRTGVNLLPQDANRVATSHARVAIEKNLTHLTSCLHSLALIP